MLKTPPLLLLKGMATLIPGVHPAFRRGIGMHAGSYHYSVWLRHLVKAGENGLPTNPGVVAELGPGSSLGTGLAALLTGAERYYAFDIVQHANVAGNLKVFDELIELLRSRADIPDDDEFPRVTPKLSSYRFPHELLPTARIEGLLSPARIARLRRSIAMPESDDSCIRYVVPWYNAEVIETDSVDMVFSQAVLEHVDNPAFTYNQMYQWLKPCGFMSHDIDYRCHHTARDWNGHWTYSDITWKVLRGRRPYFLNRWMHSWHVQAMRKAGFQIVVEKTTRQPSRIEPRHFAPRFCDSEADLTTETAFIQARKLRVQVDTRSPSGSV